MCFPDFVMERQYHCGSEEQVNMGSLFCRKGDRQEKMIRRLGRIAEDNDNTVQALLAGPLRTSSLGTYGVHFHHFLMVFTGQSMIVSSCLFCWEFIPKGIYA